MLNLTTSIELTSSAKYKLNNGLHIPVCGFGVYQLSPAEAHDLVYEALVQGYRHIDSAVVYGNEEQCASGIADFLKDHPDVPREDIWFTTKVFNDQHGYEETKKAVAGIAAKVKKYIGYVDMVLIHLPKTSKELRLGTWKALQEFYLNPTNEVLKIRTIGVSNFGIKHLEELFAWDGFIVTPAVDQLELHPWLPHLKLREYLASHDILAEAYSPLTQGVKLNDPELLALEKKFNIPKAEILLKWSYIQGFVVLAKTSKKERIKQNFNVLPHTGTGRITLDPEILDTLNKPDSHDVVTWRRQDPTLYEDQ